ncbi:MAG: hypothetical protein WD512_02890, partial [Candidatus Paceibacterota bacterium]
MTNNANNDMHVYKNLEYNMIDIISDIKEKIKRINTEEQLKMPTIKVIPMEDIILEQIGKTKESVNKKTDVPQFNILLRRQQQLTQRKQHTVSPLALEARARQLLGANSEERIVNNEMQEMLARSQAERYYKISESDNLISDIGIENFQKTWGKLDANLKINRLMKYAAKLQIDYALEEASFKNLRIILIDSVNNRKITRKNDVQYNEELGQIMDIKGLTYDPESKLFTYDPNLKKDKGKTKKEKKEKEEREDNYKDKDDKEKDDEDIDDKNKDKDNNS